MLFANYIDGEWVAGATFENRNPANTDELVGEFVNGTPADAEAAAQAAARALPGWAAHARARARRVPVQGRGHARQPVRIGRRGHDPGGRQDASRSQGRSAPDDQHLPLFRGRRLAPERHQVPSERDRVHMFAFRKPVGVVGLITPWNFPSAIPAWKLAPALICGNTVVMKPASLSPLSAWRIVEACHEAGIPKGVVELRRRQRQDGRRAGDAAPVKAVSFTGSCGVGNRLHEEASKRRIRIQLEMGGKNPTIVLGDC